MVRGEWLVVLGQQQERQSQVRSVKTDDVRLTEGRGRDEEMMIGRTACVVDLYPPAGCRLQNAECRVQSAECRWKYVRPGWWRVTGPEEGNQAKIRLRVYDTSRLNPTVPV